MLNLIIVLGQLVIVLILFILAIGLWNTIIDVVVIKPIKAYKANKLFLQLGDDIMNIINEQLKRDLEKENADKKEIKKTTKKQTKTKDEK